MQLPIIKFTDKADFSAFMKSAGYYDWRVDAGWYSYWRDR